MNKNRLFPYLLLFAYIVNFQSIGQQKWSTINFKDNFKDTLLISDHFIYNDFNFKDEEGKWQSAMSDENGNMLIDTTLYLIGANCMVDNGDPHQLNYCHCSLDSDTLLIEIYNNDAAYFDDIYIKCNGGKFSTFYRAAYQSCYTGESYIWKVKNQKLKLSTNNLQKGKWLNGFVNLDIKEFFKSNAYPLSLSTIKIKGHFKCVIE